MSTEETQQEPINIHIQDGEPFFAHEMSVNFTPTQFILDFKCITPRNDPRSKTRASFLLKHNVVMVDPWHARAIVDVLTNMIKKYEEEFGKVSMPQPLKKAEQKQKAALKGPKKGSKTASTEAPNYFG